MSRPMFSPRDIHRLACLTVIVSLVAALALAGCTSTGGSELTKQLAVRYATMKLIEQSSDPVARRDRVIELAQSFAEAASGDSVLVSALEAKVRNEIDLTGLAPSDRMLADLLIGEVTAGLRERAGDGGWLQGENLVSAREFFASILQAATLYQPETAE